MRYALVILLLFPALLAAQVDSLKQKLSAAQGKARVHLLNLLTIRDTSNSLSWHKEAIDLATTLNDKEGEADAFGAIAQRWAELQDYEKSISSYKKAIEILNTNKFAKKAAYYLNRSAGVQETLMDLEEAISNYSDALEISRKMGTRADIAGLVERLGIVHLDKRDFATALKYFQEAVLIDKELKDTTGLAASLNNTGLVYYNLGEFDKSLTYLNESLSFYKKLRDTLNTAFTLQNIAINYRDKAFYDLALAHSLEAARYFEDTGAEKELASCYNTIGNIQLEIEATEKALSYHHLALKIREKIGHKKGVAISLSNIGNVYKEQKAYNEALEYLNKALKVKEEIGDKKSIASTLALLGEVHFQKEDLALAEKYFLRSLALAQEVSDQKGIAVTSVKIGELYMKQEKYPKAIVHLEAARNIAASTGARDVLADSYSALATLYRAQGNTKLAFDYYDKHTALKDSLLNDKKNKALAEMQVKYETGRKEHQIQLLNAKQKVQAAEMENKNTTIYALGLGAGLLIIITIVSFAAYRSKRRANMQSQVIIRQKQEMIEQEKTMMKELHHRVKNNLQLLSGLLLLQKEQLQDKPSQLAIDAVDHRVNAMLLIHQELYLDKARSQVAMRDYIQRMTNNLLHAYGHTSQSVKIDFDVDDITMEAETALNLGLIINEVLSNSFKHAFAKVKQPQLLISLKKNENGKLVLKLRDNGPGITAEAMQNKRSSFGLRLVEMLGTGELKGSLEMTAAEGSCFELTI